MTGVIVTGWSVLSSAGIGVDALAGRLAGAESGAVAASPGAGVGHLYEEPLPSPNGHALTDFDVRAQLGRKGTSSYDRATALAVVCCQEALREAGMTVDDTTRKRVGVVLGTSLGSFKSTSDYSRETLIQEKPYLVNPMLFPNTVMNCAAGQVAIRFGLRGVNVTIAGGALAFLNAVRYAGNVIERGYADVMLTGAVEEYTPHRAWASHLTGATTTVAAGEAAGVFALTGPQAPQWAGPRRSARILAVTTGYGPGGGEQAERALGGCVSRALRRAGADPAEITTVLTCESDEADRREYGPVSQVLGHEPRRIMAKRLLGECDAASGAVALAVLLAGTGGTAGEGLSLLTARGADGAVGAAIVKGYGDADTDRG
ncbi:beta-ketoacyl synthase N-terminal-like domain-containing protein [Streptosporangium sp. NPDC000396]|uniref:beta-ketoacyl synthase N-terminal-like domain-containing protein n=1 Tax=Streptosporangium sp. NPDC000396 TaxID=3366185 RepID=UPI003689535F